MTPWIAARSLARRRGPALVALCLLLAAPLASAGFRLVHAPTRQDPMRVRIYRLDNGLTIYLSENRETPRFYSEIAVRAGSKMDPAESTGLAHYLEHLLFKGSQRLGTTDFEKERAHQERVFELYERHFREADPEKRRALYEEIGRETRLGAEYAVPNELDQLYKAMGEEGLNAHTWHEETVYKVGLPANRLEQWALLESDRFLHPVFRLFQPELEIVYEEKNRMLDNKEAILMEAVDQRLFPQHPYGQQTTIGRVEHLKNPSLRNVQRYYDTWYVPNNMAIVLSGDLDADRALRLVDRHFSVWKPRPLPELPGWEEAPLSGVERVTVRYKGEEMVRLAFRIPGRRHADVDALKLVDLILDNATAGLINLDLVQNQRVRAAGSGPQFNQDYSAQYLWGIPKKGQTLAEVERLLLEQLDRVKRGDFEDWILGAIVNDFKRNRKLQLESDEARVAWMRESFLSFEDWNHSLAEIDRLARLTKADVVRVANRWFGPHYVAGYRVDEQQEVPKLEKPPMEPLRIDGTRQSRFAQQVLAQQVKPVEPVFVRPGKDYRKQSLQPGVEFYYNRNPVNDLFALQVTIEVGTRHDNRLGLAAQYLDKSGTRRLPPDALRKEWYRLGSSFGVHPGENETGLTLQGLDENFEASVQLMAEALRQPVAAPETLEQLKQIVLVQREDTKKDHRAIAGALAMLNRYGEDSPYRRALPNEALRALTGEELHALTGGLLDYRLQVSYTGSLPPNTVIGILRRQLSFPASPKPAPGWKFLRVASPATNRVYFFHKEVAQAQVRIETGGTNVNEADFPAVQLFNDYFGGGMGGIVFQELREARALAYSVGAAYSNGPRKGEQNLLVGAIGCQPDKTSEAVTAFLKLFDEMPASRERFEATRDSVLTHYRTGWLRFREVLGAVHAWERLEVPVDPRRERFARVQKANLDLVLAFQRDQLRGRPRLISVVGDRARIQLDDLRRLGEFEELSLERLFRF